MILFDVLIIYKLGSVHEWLVSLLTAHSLSKDCSIDSQINRAPLGVRKQTLYPSTQSCCKKSSQLATGHSGWGLGLLRITHYFYSHSRYAYTGMASLLNAISKGRAFFKCSSYKGICRGSHLPRVYMSVSWTAAGVQQGSSNSHDRQPTSS